MQIQIFTIPVLAGESILEDMNQFLGSHRILSRRSKQRFERKLKLYYRNLESGLWSQEDFRRHVEPLVAFTNHASSKAFRRNVLKKLGE